MPVVQRNQELETEYLEWLQKSVQILIFVDKEFVKL